jgi:hypothetical protein
MAWCASRSVRRADVRTLVPSARGHVFLALYDGDCPAGQVVVTAYLKNGRTFTQRMPAWL